MSTRAREEYEALVGGLLSHVWKREGDFLVVDPAELNTPLTEVMGREEGLTRVNPDWLPSDQQELRGKSREELLAIILELIDERDEARSHTVGVMLDFIFAKGPKPLIALERLFILARAHHKGHDWNLKQGEMGQLFGRSKQDWQSIEEAVVTDLMNRFSRTQFVMSGGKSATAVQNYKKAQKGNRHRATGRKAGDELPAMPAANEELPKLTGAQKKRAKELAAECERKRLAALCGCKPEEIDLGKINPED